MISSDEPSSVSSAPDSHSFVVKIWVEQTAEEAKSAVWRGHITHVLSRRRQYVQDIDGLVQFIVPYLRQLDVPIEAADSMSSAKRQRTLWLRRWHSRFFGSTRR